MITITLQNIKDCNPCKSGWEKLIASKGGDAADMSAEFPVTDILNSNDLDDCLWALRCLPEHDNLWRKYAVWCARQVQHLMADQRSINAMDVAWRHSEGLATDDELAAARGDAWDAARGAAGFAAWRSAAGFAAWEAAWSAAWADAWAAARDAQQQKLREILTLGQWPEGDYVRYDDVVKALQAMHGEAEPVAWMVTTERYGKPHTYPVTGDYDNVVNQCDYGNPVPLYTAPQPVVPEMVHILSILNGNIWHTEASENLKLAKDFELRLYADAALLSAGKGGE